MKPFWIVWRVGTAASAAGAVGYAVQTVEDAVTIAEQMLTKNPTDKFVVMESTKVVSYTSPTWENIPTI